MESLVERVLKILCDDRSTVKYLTLSSQISFKREIYLKRRIH